jgi:FkbM family methyltransferase
MAQVIQSILSKFVYRFGRYLYMCARGDITNDMQRNGELMVQAVVVRSVATSGDLGMFFDVGANVGDWSQALLTACKEQGLSNFNIHLFEPAPSTMDTLKRNIGAQRGIYHEELAMSSASESGVLYIHGKSAGTNSLHLDQLQALDSSGIASIPILKMSAADFCARENVTHIDLMKVDAEGHDMEVIFGALPLLKQGRIGVLQFEYNHTWIFSRHYLKDVFDAVSGLPYIVGKIRPNNIEIYSTWHPEHERFFHANYVLIREDLINQFNCCECHIDKYNTLAVSGFS